MKNKELTKRVYLKRGVRPRLAKYFGVSSGMITHALTFRSMSLLSRKIRSYCLNNRLGIVY